MISLRQITVRLGSFALERINLEVPTGEYAVLMGRTGSGKTTLLEVICGLRPVASGSIWLHDQDVTRLRPGERQLGYVPQDRALFPTMTVRENLTFALTLRHASAKLMRERVAEMGDLLGIGKLLDRGVHGLSGGEAQRVALGRALAFHPRTLLLDEPLNALDEDTREEMCSLLDSIRKQTGVTTLHITHSPREAERLADRILRLDGGQVYLLENLHARQTDRSS